MANTRGSHDQGKAIQESDTEALIIVGVTFTVVGVLVLLWWKERQIFSVPLSLYLLAQLYIIELLTRSDLAAEWISYTWQLLGSSAGLKRVPQGFFVEGFSYASNKLWWLYALIAFGLSLIFVRGQTENEFLGQFHPTGREYVTEWQFGRGKAPDWMADLLDAGAEEGNRSLAHLVGAILLKITRAKKRETTRSFGSSFIRYQSRVWGIMKPIAEWDPFDCIGALGEVWRPEVWAFKNDIITDRTLNEIVSRTQNWRQTSPLVWNVIRARRVLEGQVKRGGRWEGVHKLPPYMKAIVVICHLNRNLKQQHAIQLAYECAAASVPLFRLRSNASQDTINSCRANVNERISEILRGQHNNPKLPKKALLTPQIAKEADDAARGFWWRRTTMVHILAISGPHLSWGGGRASILQPALLQWSQSLDRVLYLALNCVGGETFHAEVAGIIAQYQVEATYKRTTLARLGEHERELANLREGHMFAARESNRPTHAVMSEENKESEQRLLNLIEDEKAKLSREPDLHMDGPISWLDALVTKDRNEAGLDFLFNPPDVEAGAGS